MICSKRQLLHLVLSLGISFLLACEKGDIQRPSAQKSSPKTVSVASAQQSLLQIPIHATGRIFPKREIKLGFSIGGILQKVLAKSGQQVRAGQLLAQLDAGELSSRGDQAQLHLKQTDRALQRAKNLFEDSVITREQLEQAEVALANAEAEVKVATWYQSKASLFAPTSGIVLKRLAEAPEQIGPGQPVFLFSASQNAWVARVSLTGKDLTGLSTGDSARIRLSSYPDTAFVSYIEEISQIADPYTGTFEVDLPIRSSKELPLVSGLLGSADIFSQQQQLSWMIPVDALHITPSGRSYVWLVQDGKVEQTYVQPQQILGDQVSISSGIERPVQVVVSDPQQLQSGQTVQILDQ
ncbi:MAG: efflux RND transporter periplasmic adaptor subunit [Bacteroidota bacterium]